MIRAAAKTFLSMMLFCGVSCHSPELPSEEAILKTGGHNAELVIEKAKNILYHTQVFSTTYWDRGGIPSSACWALTVIIRYEPKPKQFLNELYLLSHRYGPYNPTAKLYAIAGLIIIDPTMREKFAVKDIPKELRESMVKQQRGCVGKSLTFGAALEELVKALRPEEYLFDELPPLYTTRDP